MADRNVFKTTPSKPTQKSFSTATSRPSLGEDEDVPKMDMKAVKSHMKKEVGDYRHANINFVKFVVHVLGVDEDHVKKLKRRKFNSCMTKDKIEAYNTAKPESQLHAPFIEFAKNLLGEAIRILHPTSGRDSLTPAIWDYKGNRAIIQEGRTRKPDMLCLYELVPHPDWGMVKFIFEFKNPSGHTKPQDPAAHAVAPAPRAFQSDTAAMTTAAGTSSGSRRSKRKREGPDAAEETQGGSRKKANIVTSDNPQFSEKFQQLAAYALEILAATSRYFVIALAIDKFKITVCYMDRFHFLRASSFSFREEPWKLALVLYGLNNCDRRQVGFDPHLRALPSTTINSIGEAIEEPDDHLDRPVQQVSGSYFEFLAVTYEPSNSPAKASNKAGAMSPYGDAAELRLPAEETATTREVKACEEEAPTSELETSSGDGTSPPEAETTTTDPVVLRVDELLRQPDDLIGRGTTVYKVRLRLPDGSYDETPYALKCSWPIEKRQSEVDIVRKLKCSLPDEARRHLPEFLFSITSSAEDLQLPWLKLGLPITDKNFQGRVLRRIASKFYHPLWEAGRLGEFKKAYLDCVQIHYLAYKKGKVLHRDISERNLMVAKLSGLVQGVLNDWDMAKFIEDVDDMLTVAHHRTNSTPFLAIDRLEDDAGTTPHLYRHELESFFYVLLWAMVHYSLTNGDRDPSVCTALVPWTQNFKANLSHKMNILQNIRGSNIKPVYDQVKEEFKPLIEQWAKPLRLLFYRSYTAYMGDSAEEGSKDTANFETYNDLLTFSTFMEALGCTEDNKDEWAIVPDILDL